MSKNIKDYLHLYQGCEVAVENYPFGKLFSSNEKNITLETKFGWQEYFPDEYHRLKPMLRPLSDITEEEVKELKKLDQLEWSSLNILPKIKASHLTNLYFSSSNAEWTRWLLSKGFDLFGLIESGLAIDKTKTESVCDHDNIEENA